MNLTIQQALKYEEGNAEVLPTHYLVVDSRYAAGKTPKQVGKYKTLSEASDRLLTGGFSGSPQVVALYPDKSVKALYSTGERSSGYGVYSNSREPLGHYQEHTPDLDLWSTTKPQAHADAAAVSEHHLTDLLNHHVSELVLRAGLSPFKGDKAIGSEPHKFIRQAMETRDHTPLLVMADYLQENGSERLAGLVRKAVEKKQELAEKLQSNRTLRTGGRK